MTSGPPATRARWNHPSPTWLGPSRKTRQIEIVRRADGWAGAIATAGQSIRVHGTVVEVDAIYGSD